MSDKAEASYNKVDHSSLSNCREVVSTDIKLEWDLDFDHQTISGSAEHIMKVLVNGTKTADFDSSKINLTDHVTIDDEKVAHSLAETNPSLGTKISVCIPADKRYEGSTFTVRFQYTITKEASAVQWLAASATKGGKHPYVFTQCQAIHARSLLPCMDSPGVKTTYSAVVTAPKWCQVLMSALADTERSDLDFEAGRSKFVWVQPVPTCAYLIALAAGNLESREISNRVRIWAEPEVVDSAHFEFAETEEFLKVAEELTCPYVWTRYDVLCLPPSFPYGGMENPCLTFATPTLLAGDRSLADVIAHEIAHSWTGNLVTNHTWDHFWLNEGWTVWLERKIVSKVKGSVEHGLLSAQIGWKHLTDDMALLTSISPEFTSLVWPLNGQDPDVAFSGVPYEKGFNLLNYLESLVGTQDFEAFAKEYLQKFKFNTVTSGEFRDCFLDYFRKKATEEAAAIAAADVAPPQMPEPKKKAKRGKKSNAHAHVATTLPPTPCADLLKVLETILDWNALFHTRGMPAVTPDFSNSLSADAEALAVQWIEAAAASTSSIPHQVCVPNGVASEDIKRWSTQQTCVFLEVLLVHCSEQQDSSHGGDRDPENIFSPDFLAAMDKIYSFSMSNNSEIMSRWQNLCLRCNADWIFPKVVNFISSQGRMKFVRPLFRALRSSRNGKQLAISTFENNKDMYHPIARKMLASDLANAQKADENVAEWEHTDKVENSDRSPPTVSPLAATVKPQASEHPSPVPATPPPAPVQPPSPPFANSDNSTASPSNESAKTAFLKKMLNIEKNSDGGSSVAPDVDTLVNSSDIDHVGNSSDPANAAELDSKLTIDSEVTKARECTDEKERVSVSTAPAVAGTRECADEKESVSVLAAPAVAGTSKHLSIKKPAVSTEEKGESFKTPSSPTCTTVAKPASRGGFFSTWIFPAVAVFSGVGIAAFLIFKRRR